MNHHHNILLAFYGDDLTGSTDALEFLNRAGAKTILFLEPPSKEQLAKYKDLHAFGVAGMTRSLSPGDMEAVLFPAFEKLKQSGARHVHYKVCSTFDSSPATGSIGKAIDTGAAVFNSGYVPLLVAAPALGRYCVFGNLFARMGIASNGHIYRLDRHPSMSNHPVTPSDESDLRLHLAKQTVKKTGLLDILQLSKSKKELEIEITNLIDRGAEIILIDALYQDQLLRIGELIDARADQSTLFSVGSSGIEMALGQYWNSKGIIQPAQDWKDPGTADPLLVLSGSCSPVTTTQINYAKANGFEEVILDTSIINNNDSGSLQSLAANVAHYLQKGKSVIVHTNSTGRQTDRLLPAEKAGGALGIIATEAIKQSRVKRIVIAGGDTSSYAARAMQIESVEMIAPLIAGAPLCRANAPGLVVDKIEINLKGGQVGAPNYFETIKNGKL